MSPNIISISKTTKSDFSILASEEMVDPRLPSTLGDPAPDFATRTAVGRGSAAPEKELIERVRAQQAYLQHVLALELKYALARRESQTAWSRAASAAFAANETDEASRAAKEVLRIGSDLREAGRQQDVDVAAFYSALQVLDGIGEQDFVLNFLSDAVATPLVRLLRARSLVARREFDRALAEVDEVTEESAPGVAAVRGYIHLERREDHLAIRELRIAQRADPQDATSALNLAIAFWRAGSQAKAIRSAIYAVKIAPHRRDAVLMLVYYLTRAGEFERARAEIMRIKNAGFVEPPELLVLHAQVELARGQGSRAITHLREAAGLARDAGNTRFAAEINGNIAVLNYFRGVTDRTAAVREVVSGLREYPKNRALIALLADLSERTTDAKTLRTYVDLLDDEDDPLVLSTSSQLAYLEGRFDDAREFASRWFLADSTSDQAMIFYCFLNGHLTEEWARNAEITLGALRSRGWHRDGVLNAAAYALALSGQGQRGLEIIGRAKVRYVTQATKGLCLISLGQVADGLRAYRRAADLADKEDPTGVGRVLMTIHQAMCLRRLGLLESQRNVEIDAAALPPVELPDNWTDYPDFHFYQFVARRRGWPWPSMFE